MTMWDSSDSEACENSQKGWYQADTQQNTKGGVD